MEGLPIAPSFMHLPSPIAIQWSLYVFCKYICFPSLSMYTVHSTFSVANDKNRTETTLSKLVDFICSLNGKFKAGTGLSLMYALGVSLSMFSHTIDKLSLHDQKDANQPCALQLPILKKKGPKVPTFHVSNLMEGTLMTLIWLKHCCYL